MAAKFRGYKPQPPKQVQLSPALQQKFQQALTLHQKGMTTQAQNMCEEILKVQPKHFDTLYLLGVSMSQTGQLKKAEETLSAAIKINTLHPPAYNNHGVVLMGLERPEEAIASYNKAISLKRDYANAFYNRGVALATLKRLDEAISSYDEAINLKPDYAKAHDNRGNALKELNRLDEAIISYDRAISLKPDYADACYNRGVTLLTLNRLDEAIDSYDKAISLKPNYAEAYYNRGVTLATLRRFDKALASYDKAISLKPDYAEAYYNRGNALKDLNQLDEAIASYDKAISLKPDYPEAYNNRGNVLKDLKRLQEALASYDKAIKRRPDYSIAYNNRGLALSDLNRHEEALASYDNAINIKPDDCEAYNNRGNALQKLQRFDEALASYDKAISIKPDFAEAYNNRGEPLQDLKRFDEAIASYDKAISLKPDIRYLLGRRLHTKMRICNWTMIETDLTILEHKVSEGNLSATPWITFGLFDSPQVQQTAAKIYVKSEFNSQQRVIINPSERASPTINIGYFSSDFRNHAMSFLLAEMFEEHSRQDFRFHGFAYGPKSDDPMRKRVSSAFDTFTEINNKSDDEVFTLCREHQIDIAVDLNGFTNHSRTSCFAARCAPIQVNYMGFAGTMGADFIDYIIADSVLVPPHYREFYTEKIVYLPDSYMANDSKREISNRAFTRGELGLPEEAFVFCCFNNNWKMTPNTFDSWARILQQVDGSVLWLFQNNESAARNLRNEAEKRGVNPDRLVFAKKMPIEEHLSRHRLADLFLDTLPCNAHTTASDALWSGLPVLTCIGNSFAARVAASLLNALGMTELIVDDMQKYEELAVTLAKQPSRLAEIKGKLNRNRLTSSLFSGEAFARTIEAAYREMFARYQKGLPPDHIFVSRSSG